MASNLKNRPGIPETEESKKEWEKAFSDMEEAFKMMEVLEEKENPFAKYKKLKQQSFPDFP